jgi:mycothiol system anti-sigma-R factor
MADCTETLKELETYLDAELADERVSEIMSHLTECVDCQGAYEFHAELKAIIRFKAQNEALPEGFLTRLANCFGEDVLPTDKD